MKKKVGNAYEKRVARNLIAGEKKMKRVRTEGRGSVLHACRLIFRNECGHKGEISAVRSRGCRRNGGGQSPLQARRSRTGLLIIIHE